MGATTIVLLVGALLLSVNITKPFIGQHDWNGVVYGQQAKNFVRYGYLPLKFGATLSAGNRPIEDLTIVTHYPPTLPILISASYRLFSVHEWSTRFVPLVASLASVFLTILLGRKLASARIGFLAGCFFVLTPMFIYYGKNPVHEVVQLPFSLLAFYSYLWWRKKNENVWWFVLLSSLISAMLIGWPGYYATGFITLHGLVFDRSKRMFIVFPLLAIGLFVFYIWHIQLVSPGSIAEIGTAAVSRIGSSGFPLAEWVQRELRYAINLYTGTLLALSGLWALRVLWNVARRRINDDDIFLGFLGLYGVAHAVLFRDASWFHEYLLFPLLPFLAITSAIVVNNVIIRLKIHAAKVFVIASVLIAVGFERAGYAKALLTSEYARRDYEEALQFARDHEGQRVRIPEERDVYFVFYADQIE